MNHLNAYWGFIGSICSIDRSIESTQFFIVTVSEIVKQSGLGRSVCRFRSALCHLAFFRVKREINKRSSACWGSRAVARFSRRSSKMIDLFENVFSLTKKSCSEFQKERGGVKLWPPFFRRESSFLPVFPGQSESGLPHWYHPCVLLFLLNR